jgi:hypothetical protein
MQLSSQLQLIVELEPNRKLFLPPILPRNKKPTKKYWNETPKLVI